MVKMIPNILRMLCVAAFLGIMLFSLALNTNTRTVYRNNQDFINYKPLNSRRMVHSHQQHAPNIIYLGDDYKSSDIVSHRLKSR